MSTNPTNPSAAAAEAHDARAEKRGDRSEAAFDYLVAHSVREVEAQRALRERTMEMGRVAIMQTGIDQVQFMQWLLRMMGARRTIEVGVFTGYSALGTALALPEDGRVVALDVSEEFTSIGKPFWKQAGADGRIDLRLGDAVASMDAMVAAGEAGTYDFCFIDADKTGYDAYYERALVLLRRGGVVAIDNVMWHSQVVDATDQSPDTVAIRVLNDKVYADARVEMCMLGIADGLTLARKL